MSFIMILDVIEPSVPSSSIMLVLRRPPPLFSVGVLSPTKHEGTCYYRMLISPVNSSDPPYEVWRSWSDCLIFQKTLEEEYGRMTSPNEQRDFVAEHGSNHGIHNIHYNEAVSPSGSEYLSPSSDANSTHLDLHLYLPTLTRKGTVFWDSPATVDRRRGEMEAFIGRLFSSDAPTLLCQLRQDHIITNFFAFWRSDDGFIKRKRVAAEGSADHCHSASSSPNVSSLACYSFSNSLGHPASQATSYPPYRDLCPGNQPGNFYSIAPGGPVGGSSDGSPNDSTSTLASTTSTMSFRSMCTTSTDRLPLLARRNAGFRRGWWRRRMWPGHAPASNSS